MPFRRQLIYLNFSFGFFLIHPDPNKSVGFLPTVVSDIQEAPANFIVSDDSDGSQDVDSLTAANTKANAYSEAKAKSQAQLQLQYQPPPQPQYQSPSQPQNQQQYQPQSQHQQPPDQFNRGPPQQPPNWQ